MPVFNSIHTREEPLPKKESVTSRRFSIVRLELYSINRSITFQSPEVGPLAARHTRVRLIAERLSDDPMLAATADTMMRYQLTYIVVVAPSRYDKIIII